PVTTTEDVPHLVAGPALGPGECHAQRHGDRERRQHDIAGGLGGDGGPETRAEHPGGADPGRDAHSELALGGWLGFAAASASERRMQNSLPSGSARITHPVPGPYCPRWSATWVAP